MAFMSRTADSVLIDLGAPYMQLIVLLTNVIKPNSKPLVES